MTTTPQRFTKRPVTIEAIQLTSENTNEVAHWCGGRAIHEAKASDHTDVYTALDIPTLEGVMRGNVGDWIVRGVQGEFYPCKDAIFRETYEPAAEHHGEPNADDPTDAEVEAALWAWISSAAEGVTRENVSPRVLDLNRPRARAALVAARKVSTPPPSEPIIEATAHAMSNCDRPAHGPTPEWDHREPEERNRYRALAHVAIRTAWQAARKAARHE